MNSEAQVSRNRMNPIQTHQPDLSGFAHSGRTFDFNRRFIDGDIGKNTYVFCTQMSASESIRKLRRKKIG